MKYVMLVGDCDLPVTQAAFYLEIDDQNAVIRQVEVAGATYRWGKWTGDELVGFITDQPVTAQLLEEAHAVVIGADEFESVWLRAISE